VILTTESETETKTSQPFKVMAKLVPSLKCGDEYYVPSTPAADKSLKNNKVASSSAAAGSPNTPDDVRRKLFASEQKRQVSHGSEVTADSNRVAYVKSVNDKCDDGESASRDSDDVIVESEEDNETSKLPNGATNLADDSDDVIVESESDN